MISSQARSQRAERASGPTRRRRLRVHRDTAGLHRVDVRRVIRPTSECRRKGQFDGIEQQEAGTTCDAQDRVWRLREPRAQGELCPRAKCGQRARGSARVSRKVASRRTIRHGAADAEHGCLLARHARDPILERSSRLVLVVNVVAARRLQAGWRTEKERAHEGRQLHRLFSPTSPPIGPDSPSSMASLSDARVSNEESGANGQRSADRARPRWSSTRAEGCKSRTSGS